MVTHGLQDIRTERTSNADRPMAVDGRRAATVGMGRREFLTGIAERLRRELPDPLSAFKHRLGMNLLKIFYDNERVHYEVWIDGQRGQLGVGLHFEDGPLSTAAYLAFFDAHIVELKHDLGTGLELERWTASWGHIYELAPLGRLDTPTVERTACRLAALIAALEPLVEAATIPAERGASAEQRGPWRAWRRGRG